MIITKREYYKMYETSYSTPLFKVYTYKNFYFYEKKVAPRKGFEPSTYRLTAECSTVELSRNIDLATTYPPTQLPVQYSQPLDA